MWRGFAIAYIKAVQFKKTHYNKNISLLWRKNIL